MRTSLLFLFTLATFLTVTQASPVWQTNTTIPPPGDWLVHVQVECTGTPCQTRLLYFDDWKLTTAWCQQGSGSFTFPYNFQEQTYFFRVQNGALHLDYTLPATAFASKCPIAYQWVAVATFIAGLVYNHGSLIRPWCSKPCPFKGVGSIAVA